MLAAAGAIIASQKIVQMFWLAVLVLATSCARPLDRKRLHAAVRDLRAVAAETHLLRREAARGASDLAYVDEQRAFLAEGGRKAHAELERGVEDPALEPARRRASEIAGHLLPLVDLERDPHAFEDAIGELSRIEARVVP